MWITERGSVMAKEYVLEVLEAISEKNDQNLVGQRYSFLYSLDDETRHAMQVVNDR